MGVVAGLRLSHQEQDYPGVPENVSLWTVSGILIVVGRIILGMHTLPDLCRIGWSFTFLAVLNIGHIRLELATRNYRPVVLASPVQ